MFYRVIFEIAKSKKNIQATNMMTLYWYHMFNNLNTTYLVGPDGSRSYFHWSWILGNSLSSRVFTVLIFIACFTVLFSNVHPASCTFEFSLFWLSHFGYKLKAYILACTSVSSNNFRFPTNYAPISMHCMYQLRRKAVVWLQSAKTTG